jgi:hypothetical protein
MMSSVHILPMNLPTDFTDGINTVGNFIGKIVISLFFLLYFNYFVSHCNFLGIYQENIVVGKIHRKVTDRKILLIVSFVFIDFLVVTVIEDKILLTNI